MSRGSDGYSSTLDGVAEDTPVQRLLRRDVERGGAPLTERARTTARTIENYLQAGGRPRWMERLMEIDNRTRAHRAELARAYRRTPRAQWRALAERWDFSEVNDLIRQHNEWYPVERDLPMDPRTKDYVLIRGRSYRRDELGPAWILERFPA
jgi:hypothetical protein